MPYVNNKDADHPALQCSLIGDFVTRCLESKYNTYICYIYKISRHKLVPVAEQAGLSLIWSQTPEDRFSCVKAHMTVTDLKICQLCVKMRPTFKICLFAVYRPEFSG